MIGRFLLRHRTLIRLLHPLIHRGVRPYRFAQHGCVVCRSVWGALLPYLREKL